MRGGKKKADNIERRRDSQLREADSCARQQSKLWIAGYLKVVDSLISSSQQSKLLTLKHFQPSSSERSQLDCWECSQQDCWEC